jgi:hypothetical protein
MAVAGPQAAPTARHGRRAFIGAVHRIAASRRPVCVGAAALSSNAERGLAATHRELHISRAYRSFEEMASSESSGPME